MRYLNFFVFLIIFSDRSVALVNGEPIPITEKVPLVRIEFENDSHICSGVFLDRFTILTAAHCIGEKKYWEGQSFKVKKILDRNENEIPIVQIKNIPHPEYKTNWFGNYHDLGIIKVMETDVGNNFPELFNSKDMISDQVTIYGCGLVHYGSKIRKCHKGVNSWFTLFGQIFSFGRSNLTETSGRNASIANNDSGGPVISALNQIVGVNWGTFLSSTSKWNLPNLNFITDLTDPNNLIFLKENLGNPITK